MKDDPRMISALRAPNDSIFHISMPSVGELWYMVYNNSRIEGNLRKLRNLSRKSLRDKDGQCYHPIRDRKVGGSNPLAPTTFPTIPRVCPMAIQARHIIVHGRVQGVGFRFFVQRAGSRLGLTGDVCNLPDGTVQIMVEGAPEVLAGFIREVKLGPPAAHVDRLEVHEVAASGKYKSFLLEGW